MLRHKNILIALSILLVITAVSMLHVQAQSLSPARFQLVPASYTIWLKGAQTTSEPTVFRIDTSEGGKHGAMQAEPMIREKAPALGWRSKNLNRLGAQV